MSAGWVAGSVRARAMARRRMGTAGIRAVAAMDSLAPAVDLLARSSYGLKVLPGASLDAAQRAIGETLLWHMRVLAGWLPSAGAQMLRVLAAGFEIANMDELVRGWDGLPADPPFRLGSLATAWPNLSRAAGRTELREALARSPWGDPGGDTLRDLQIGPRLAWSERICATLPAATSWALAAVALLVARELVSGRRLTSHLEGRAVRLIGPAAQASSLPELADRLPPASSWALGDVRTADDLWLAEARWWARLHRDGKKLASGSGFGADRVIGAMALLAADAAGARGALEIAARGGTEMAVLDAMA